MTIEEELKQAILKQYKSIREFSIAVNIPYSTIDSIFKRGVLNSGVNTIIKICQALKISVDDLLGIHKEQLIKKIFSYGTELKQSIYEDLNDLEFNQDELEELRNYIDYMKYKRNS